MTIITSQQNNIHKIIDVCIYSELFYSAVDNYLINLYTKNITKLYGIYCIKDIFTIFRNTGTHILYCEYNIYVIDMFEIESYIYEKRNSIKLIEIIRLINNNLNVLNDFNDINLEFNKTYDSINYINILTKLY